VVSTKCISDVGDNNPDKSLSVFPFGNTCGVHPDLIYADLSHITPRGCAQPMQSITRANRLNSWLNRDGAFTTIFRLLSRVKPSLFGCAPKPRLRTIRPAYHRSRCPDHSLDLSSRTEVYASDNVYSSQLTIRTSKFHSDDPWIFINSSIQLAISVPRTASTFETKLWNHLIKPHLSTLSLRDSVQWQQQR
jgi:hypothetical protein